MFVRTKYSAGLLGLVSLLCASTPAEAQERHRMCRISVGRVTFCGSPYTGRAIVFYNNAYRSCDISMGRVVFCRATFSGVAVVRQQGRYRSCDISMGRVVFCRAPFSGQTIVPNSS